MTSPRMHLHPLPAATREGFSSASRSALSLPPCAAILAAFACAAILVACGDGGGGGGGTGNQGDAGPSPLDAGASGREDGGGAADTGAPLDAGALDAGATGDASVRDASDVPAVDGGPFFDAMPSCDTPDTTDLPMRLSGSVDGHAISYDSTMTFVSVSGVMLTMSGQRATDPRLTMTWSRNLPEGVVQTATGGWLAAPDQLSGSAGGYCIVQGEIAGASSTAPDPTVVYVRVLRVQARSAATESGTCTGPILAADLVGCVSTNRTLMR